MARSRSMDAQPLRWPRAIARELSSGWLHRDPVEHRLEAQAHVLGPDAQDALAPIQPAASRPERHGLTADDGVQVAAAVARGSDGEQVDGRIPEQVRDATVPRR